jgi:glycine cleavage system transcriptional repressor
MLHLPPANFLIIFSVSNQGFHAMSQQLVVTAIGTDRTGIVSKLARLVTDCNCNIIDSRMAIFGSEFTFLMLLSGDPAAISRIEHLLPGLGLELDLTTMTKRTSAHQRKAVAAHYVLEYSGSDRVGTLGAITGLLANRHIYIGSLQSESKAQAAGPSVMHTMMTLELPEGEDPHLIERDIMTLLGDMQLSGSFHAQA